MNRRGFVAGTMGMAAGIAMPNIARAQIFTARQYHPQPQNSHLQIYLSRIWDAVRAETGGRLDVTVYPQNNGVAMGDPDLLKELQAGELEFFVLNGNILSQAHPVTDIQGIPFAFSNPEQATALWDGALGDYMRAELAGTGIRLIPFGGMENGLKQITTIDKPIHTAADLEGFRMRVPAGKLFVDFYESLGAEPKVINFNRLYQALAAREVDGQENPLVVAEENRLYDVCKFVSLTNHQWAGFNMLASESLWRRLPEDIQNAIVRNTKRFVPAQREFVRTANAGYEQTLKEHGMVFNIVDTTSFRERLSAANFYTRWRESVGARAWSLMESAVGTVG